ncbi:MAG: NADH-quinone oxidoreductase subunit A [Candidatus Omnitrophota bacterium]|jgi:NADH-quinone oxidoreductase subunit A
MQGIQLLIPPVAFIVILLTVIILNRIFSSLSFKNKQSEESGESYACGEDFQEHMVQPDYSQFFPFAYFFTILHVVVLVIATVPAVNARTFTSVLIYILGAVLGLFTLLRSK